MKALVLILFLFGCVKGSYYDSNGVHIPDWNNSMNSIQNGEMIYKASSPSCASCHGFDALGKIGPQIKGVSSAKLGNAVQIGYPNAMPAYMLTSQQMQALMDYINSL